MQELRELPVRVAGVELQILQLREEMGAAFSATRSELRAEMHGIRDELRGEIHGIRDELRLEIQAGNQETRTFMRMLMRSTRRRPRRWVKGSQSANDEGSQAGKARRNLPESDLDVRTPQ